ncbi:hypothetical protein LXL04_028357 [Taraxacum kok-saghyz]
MDTVKEKPYTDTHKSVIMNTVKEKPYTGTHKSVIMNTKLPKIRRRCGACRRPDRKSEGDAVLPVVVRRGRVAEQGGDVGAGRRWWSRWPVGSRRAGDGPMAMRQKGTCGEVRGSKEPSVRSELRGAVREQIGDVERQLTKEKARKEMSE